MFYVKRNLFNQGNVCESKKRNGIIYKPDPDPDPDPQKTRP